VHFRASPERAEVVAGSLFRARRDYNRRARFPCAIRGMERNPYEPLLTPAPSKEPSGVWQSANRGAVIGAAILGVLPCFFLIFHLVVHALFGSDGRTPEIAEAAAKLTLNGGVYGSIIGAIVGWYRQRHLRQS
jgi:hypothetical protein